MLGKVGQDMFKAASSNITDFGGENLYRKNWFMDYADLPQNLVAGPTPRKSLPMHNIYNVPPMQLVMQTPPPTRNMMENRLRSRYTFLPIGKRNQIQGGSQ